MRSIGHDPETNTLEVQLANGSVYSYDGVGAEKYQEFLTAASPGQYFAKNIRGVHSFTKIA